MKRTHRLRKQQRIWRRITHGVVLCSVVSGAVFGVVAVRSHHVQAYGADAFVMVVQTDNPGTSNATSFTIPITGTGYSYNVDCNDDGINEVTARTTSYTCVYGAAGTYTVAITGTFPRIYFNNGGDRQKLLEVQQWGTGAWTSMASAFYGASNMHVTATDAPNLSNVTSMASMFRDATSMNENINHWDVSNVTDMSYLFAGRWYNGAAYVYSSFNQPLDNWDTSAVTNMRYMFYNASAFNQPLTNFNTSAVTSMYGMFSSASAFNQPLTNFDTSAVTNMRYMFYNASAFNQPLTNFDTSAVTNMSYMFYNASAFNQPLTNFDTSAVTNMSGMFQSGGYGLSMSFNQSIEGWNTGNVTDMSYMFAGSTAFNQPLNSWNVSSVTNMSYMFGASNCAGPCSGDGRQFNQPLDTWDTSAVTNMSGMFQGASAFNQPLTNWDTSAVTNMYGMFWGASAFNQDISGWDVTGVTNMADMFKDTTLPTTTYNAILAGWSNQTLQPNVNFHGGNACYTDLVSRTVLTSAPNNWVITDGGLCPPTVTYPKNNNIISSATPVFTGVAALPNIDITVEIKGVQYTAKSNSDNTFSVPVTNSLSYGPHTARVSAEGVINHRYVTFIIYDDSNGIGLSGLSNMPRLTWGAIPAPIGSIWTKQTNHDSNVANRSDHNAVVFNDKLWVIGGYSNGSYRNDVWYSEDGVTWVQATDNAAWSARYGNEVVVYNDKLWVIGGNSNGSFLNDVWYSEDGVTWVQATDNAAWSAREGHATAVFKEKMWVIGGCSVSDCSPDNDVWYSEDGVTWVQAISKPERATAFATWGQPTILVNDNKMWRIGGENEDWEDSDDVWYTEDGTSWVLAGKAFEWEGRTAHTATIFDNRIWVIGGYAGGSTSHNDVWSTDLNPATSYRVCWDTVANGCSNSATTTATSFTIPSTLANGNWYFSVRAEYGGEVLGVYTTSSPYVVGDGSELADTGDEQTLQAVGGILALGTTLTLLGVRERVRYRVRVRE